MKLGWKVFKVLEASSDLAAAPFVPGPGNFETLRRKFGACGVDGVRLEALSAAEAGFEDVVRRHAGDRRTFETMTSGAAAGAREAVSLEHRRAAYRAAVQVWGMRMESQMTHMLVRPCAVDPERVDIASMIMLSGLCRLRPGAAAAVFVNSVVTDDEDGTRVYGVSRALADEEALPHAAPLGLVGGMCEGPVDEIEVSAVTEHLYSLRLPSSMVGLTEVMHLTAATRNDGAAYRYRENASDTGSVTSFVQSPMVWQTVELALEGGVMGEGEPWVSVYADRSGRLEHPREMREDMRVDCPCVVERVDRSMEAPSGVDARAYRERLGWFYDRLGADRARFSVYRVSVQYPSMLTRLVLRFPLAARPS
jgi:hypothetical protein